MADWTLTQADALTWYREWLALGRYTAAIETLPAGDRLRTLLQALKDRLLLLRFTAVSLALPPVGGKREVLTNHRGDGQRAEVAEGYAAAFLRTAVQGESAKGGA